MHEPRVLNFSFLEGKQCFSILTHLLACTQLLGLFHARRDQERECMNRECCASLTVFFFFFFFLFLWVRDEWVGVGR